MTDLKRNSLVSVFLRILEYYDGILILINNRVLQISDPSGPALRESDPAHPEKDLAELSVHAGGRRGERQL